MSYVNIAETLYILIEPKIKWSDRSYWFEMDYSFEDSPEMDVAEESLVAFWTQAENSLEKLEMEYEISEDDILTYYVNEYRLTKTSKKKPYSNEMVSFLTKFNITVTEPEQC